MNGIDKITASIEAGVLAEVSAIRDETEARCREIKEASEKQAKEEYEAIIEQGKKDCETRAERIVSAAGMETRKTVLAMKQEMVSKAFELAVDKVCSLPEDEYVAFLARQAANAADTGLEEIVFNEKDKAAVGKKVAKSANDLLGERGLPGKLTVSEAVCNIRGGLLLRQGDIEVNCAVETIASSLRSQMASEVANAMF